MAVLSWGKCKIETTPSTNGAPTSPEAWKALDTPKEDTTKITPRREPRRPPQRRAANLLMSVTERILIHSNLTCLSKKVRNARLKTMTG